MSLAGWWCSLRYGKPLVVVSGLPRSGTSMAMQMLQAGGLEIATDSIRNADDDNPKGYYELERVKDLDKPKDKAWLKAYRGKAIKIISFLLRELPQNLNYKVVFVDRDLDEVLTSQNKMLKNRSQTGGTTDDEKMKANYTDHLWRVRYLLKHTPNFKTLFVGHRDIVTDATKQAQRIDDFLGLHMDITAMAKAVDPKLYRNRVDNPPNP